MMKRMLVLFALATSAFAAAQEIQTPVNLGLRVGFAYPLDKVTREVTGDLIGFGGDYFLDRSLFTGGESVLSFDWLGRGLNGDKGNIFSLCFNQRWYTSGDYENSNRTYFSVGAGIATIDIVTSKSVAAAKIGMGMELGEHIYGETVMYYSDASGGARATSVGFYLGYRF